MGPIPIRYDYKVPDYLYFMGMNRACNLVAFV
jgi:hypothetical protein